MEVEIGSLWSPLRHRTFERRNCLRLENPSSQRVPNPPEFARPGWSRSKEWSSAARGCKFGCVCPVYPSVRVQIWVWLICVMSTCSNGAVQFRWVWSSLIFGTSFKPEPLFVSQSGPPRPRLPCYHGVGLTKLCCQVGNTFQVQPCFRDWINFVVMCGEHRHPHSSYT